MSCLVCGAAASTARCDNCALCGDLLADDPLLRLRALQTATERPKVVSAALRGGALFEGVVVQGEDLGHSVMVWLMGHGVSLTWARYVAEDPVWGWVAQPALIATEPERSLLRLPVWVAQPHGRGAATVRAFVGTSPERVAVAAMRLASCGIPEALWRDGLPQGAGLAADVSVWAAQRTPTATTWRPSGAAGGRRWPFGRTEAGLPLCCSICGEALPGEGPCGWCGTSPDDEPPMRAPLGDLLAPRQICATCGFDQATALGPVRCGGCGARAIRHTRG